MILGGTIFSRTYSAGDRLENKVAASWGSPQVQAPPAANYWVKRTHTEVSSEQGHKVSREVTESVPVDLPVESSRVNVAIRLDPRQKGLLWYSTYAVEFSGAYVFQNPTAQSQYASFQLKFPASQAVYDDLAITANGQALPIRTDSNGATVSATIPASGGLPLKFSYRSQGMSSWVYKFGDQVSQVHDFALSMHTNFKDIDFPADSLRRPRSRKSRTVGHDVEVQ